jgi:uncharacterized membrane-anchored protein YitT (DUF2179 family)
VSKLVIAASITLADTGFDAWCLAFIGGLCIGLGLGLVVQAGRRRARDDRRAR